MEACYAKRSKGCHSAVPQIPIRKLPHQIHTRAFCIVTCTPLGTTNERYAKYGRRTATSAEWGRARRISGQGAAPVCLARSQTPVEMMNEQETGQTAYRSPLPAALVCREGCAQLATLE